MSPFCSLSVRLAGIVRCALGVLAELGPTGLATGLATGPVLVAIHRCVQRRLRRFERLMARLAAGRPAVVRTPVVRTDVPSEVKRRAARRASLVPRGPAWAVKMARGTAAFGSQLQALLAEPDVAAVLAQSPEARAILRPLCRMLAMPVPDALQPEGWAPKVRTVRPPRRRLRAGQEYYRFDAKHEKWRLMVARGSVGPPGRRWGS